MVVTDISDVFFKNLVKIFVKKKDLLKSVSFTNTLLFYVIFEAIVVTILSLSVKLHNCLLIIDLAQGTL